LGRRLPWSEITLTVPNALKDAASGELSELGAVGIWESGETSTGHTELVAYFVAPANVDNIRNAMQTLFQRAGSISPTLEFASVEDRDWGEEWKKTWYSFPMGERFFVMPSWENSFCPPDRSPLSIDPGQAFGTGTHETTQLTLEAMERWMKPGQVVLDLGTGSGLLAIAATRLGAKAVLACDIDPIAVEVARENLETNSAQSVGLMCASIDAVASESIDFLLCNLTADAITEVLPEIQRVMRPQGIAAFSGILISQRTNVRRSAERSGFAALSETTRGEWAALVARKNGR
jgi:ribosomal protein L11 methyltransferase